MALEGEERYDGELLKKVQTSLKPRSFVGYRIILTSRLLQLSTMKTSIDSRDKLLLTVSHSK